MLVYISADNTLYNNAQVSLRQLTEASLLNNVEIIVQLDGPTPARYLVTNALVGAKRCFLKHEMIRRLTEPID